jgi:CRISPR-associated protein (TIGR03986 family)
MKTGTLNKNQGNNHDWTLKIGQKSTPVNWENIPLDWHGAEVTFTRNHNGAIDSLSHNGKIVHHPTLFTAPKASIRSEIKATQGKDDFRERDNRKSNRNSYTHQAPRTNQPNTRNQEMSDSHTPYNFVPLNDVVVSAHSPISDRSTFGGHSGYIVFDVESLTHLFIKGKDYDFFKIGSKNAIPGSSLRGMIRSLVEMVSFGKFERYNDDFINYRLGDASNKSTGRTDYFIRIKPIVDNRKMGFLDNNLKGEFVITSTSHIPTPTTRNSNFRYFPSMNDSGIMHVEIQTKGVGNSIDFKIEYRESNTNRQFIIYDKVLRSYKNDSMRKAEGEMEDLIKTVNKSDNDLKKYCHDNNTDYIGLPVWYELDDTNTHVVSFGHCRNYRIPYTNSVGDAGPKSINKKISEFDFASSIFGFSKKEKDENGNEKTEMYAGKVFFEDVTTESKDTQDAILQILAAPKPKSGKLYLEPNGSDPGRWSDNPKIRGYKMYHHRNTDSYVDDTNATSLNEEQINWQKTRFTDGHFNNLRLNNEESTIFRNSIQLDDRRNPFHFTKKLSDNGISNNLKNKIRGNANNSERSQFKTVKALPPQTTFKGARIRFEHLTDEELGALLFVMDLPGDCRHKIGMGKPLGMGSIHLKNIKLTIIDRKLRYQSLFIDSNSAWNTGESDSELKRHKDKFISYVNEKIDHNGDLWQHPRMKELHALLRFDNEVIKRVDFLKETNYMHLKEFANRGNLPKASVVKNKFFNK